jgi:hypothetical protein
MSKFNKFNILLETAFSHYSNGGFREGSPVKIRDAFFKSEYCLIHYGKEGEFIDYLKDANNKGIFFFIKRVVGSGSEQNVKDANENEGSGKVYLVLKQDPRTVSVGTELSEFTVPGDIRLIEVLNFGVNLPPVQGVPNKYEKPPVAEKPQEAKVNYSLGNQPKDNSLPKTNIKITVKN